jgi:hypothetical protein
VDVHALEGEAPEQFQQRRQELDAAVRQLHAERVEVIVTNK